MAESSAKNARLVLLARAGDRDALEQVLSGVQARLLGYISGVVGRTAADDVLQETLLQICRNLKWLRDPELFVPWAYRIASRACFKTLKHDHRYPAVDQDSAAVDEIPAASQPERQLFSDVPDLLAKISPASRSVLNLHYVQDMPVQDVAAILGLGVGTVKSRLAYGLACLRQIVAERKKS